MNRSHVEGEIPILYYFGYYIILVPTHTHTHTEAVIYNCPPGSLDAKGQLECPSGSAE